MCPETTNIETTGINSGKESIPSPPESNKPIITDISCGIKFKTPNEYGYTDWEHVNEALERRKNTECFKRINPCGKTPRWWTETKSCMKCPDSIWELNYCGKKMTAKPTFKQFQGRCKKLEIFLEETGEIFTCNKSGIFE